MKGTWKAAASVLAACLLLSGCVRVVNEVRPAGGNMDLTTDDTTGDNGTAGGVRTEAETASTGDTAGEAETGPADDDAEERVRLVLSEETYDEVKQIAAGERFAVRNGDVWGVVDANGREIYAPEYDYIETDGNGLFSLTKEEDGYFDARVYYYDAKTGGDREVFTNEEYPEYDFTEIYTPFLTMSPRDNDRLDLMYVEAEHAGGFQFEFFRLSKFDRTAIENAGMNAGKWEEASGYMKTMTTDGGSFISTEDWEQDGAGYTNVVGIDGLNQIVLSEIERGRTIRMMPYAADDAGNYAAYLVELPSGNGKPAYGNLKDIGFAAAGLTTFPSETDRVIPDLSSGTARAGRSGRAVLADKDGNEAIFNMGTGKAVTEFLYRSILLSGDNRYPCVATENGNYVYITSDGKTRDAGEPAYTAASLYDEENGYALVVDASGNLYAIDRIGKRVSAKEEGFADSRVVYLNGDDSHAFAVETNGKVRICIPEEQ